MFRVVRGEREGGEESPPLLTDARAEDVVRWYDRLHDVEHAMWLAQGDAIRHGAVAAPQIERLKLALRAFDRDVSGTDT